MGELTDSIGDVDPLRWTRISGTLYWNKASERLTGIMANDAIGRSLFEIFPEMKGSYATEMYKKAMATGTEQTFLNEHRVKDKDCFFR